MQIVPPFGLIFCASFARFDADVVVVRADIGDAELLVLRQKVGVPGQHRDAGFLGARAATLAMAAALAGGDRDAVDALGDQVGHDLHLLVTAAVLAAGR